MTDQKGKAAKERSDLRGTGLDQELIKIGSWTQDPNPMDNRIDGARLRRSEGDVVHARAPQKQLREPSIQFTLPRKEMQHQDTYRWTSLRHLNCAAQQNHRTISKSAGACSAASPSKLQKRRHIRGLSNDLSVSETALPGQLRNSVARNTPRSCDSLELGALDDRLRSRHDLSLAFEHWLDQSARNDPWVARAEHAAGDGVQGGLLDDEGASRRGSAILICD
jgi:hypothetical protein